MKTLPVFLLAFLLFFGSCLVLPNGTPIRLQGYINIHYVVLTVAGLYVLFRLNAAAGLLVLYATFEAMRTIPFEILGALEIMVLVYVFIASHDWRGYRGYLYDTLIAIAGLNLIFQVMQYFHVRLFLLPVPGAERALPGLMGNVDETFALYMICLPAFFRRRRWQLLIPVAVVGLLLSSPLVSSSVHYRVGEHLAGRLNVWMATLKDAWATAPWIGKGFSHYVCLNPRTKEVFLEAHSEYVEIAWRFGIAGCVLAGAFLYRAFRQGFSSRDRIPAYGLLAACVSALGFFPWHIVPLALLTVFWLGMIEAGKRRFYEKSSIH